ncbi:MAG: phosphoribosylformylglycinamidine synthase subunit PurQ, partial [Burkholderiales bacterium]
QHLHEQQAILAYHDKSDGGLLASISEMIFASRIGVKLNLEVTDLAEFLFNEEIGVILQIKHSKLAEIKQLALAEGLTCTILGEVNLAEDNLTIFNHHHLILDESRIKLQQAWSQVSYTLQQLRDNPQCAEEEFTLIESNNPGLFAKLSFDLAAIQAPHLKLTKPKVAILREQGVNGHLEMAASFVKAGFSAVDVHLNDIIAGKIKLADFVGLAACGGFSYGDVLGAGQGFAKSILFNSHLKDEFTGFFNRQDTFALGVCNGCQMMAYLTEIIPGSENFPRFTRNLSEQFEARLVMVEVANSPSILFKDMLGSQLPIVVSHGEGFAQFTQPEQVNQVKVALRYINNAGQITEQYPLNPNGSPGGITAVTNNDGRFTLMMPHPERTFKSMQMSWHDKSWDNMGPWFKLFLNARDFVN